ncbi:TonB-dependent receptor family protein [Flavobacterium aurantiibacter]|uniref:TonB-dependent receptor n=1 Tax=Flavobacterium aurantiibacter TaxID=2023067 RepID=A0A255ZR34_9FLAO|nr:TonB-dependent receptor [Flavobacterium aurantiibacter]OYQ43384.1 hypothetical protein CHX27_10320 [Flavobacterium aurantiibacter]
MKLKTLAVFSAFLFSVAAFSQDSDLALSDTIKQLDNVIIETTTNTGRIIGPKDNIIYNGKKSEVYVVSNLTANTANNNVRQSLIKAPGLQIWENDGSGVQVNIGARGLSPNRSWEFNVRQNGYDISSDVFGYPEAYYNPPLEAVERIEFVRGGASLQFGPQFGGTVNYILKKNHDKPFSFTTSNTIGSYGLLSSFNMISGKVGKFTYTAYNQSRSGNGWRDNNRFNVRNSHINLGYEFNDKHKLLFEYTNMNYVVQQPGGLTDEQFRTDAQQSARKRNWFNVPWNVFALKYNIAINESFSINNTLFGLIGERNSVGNTEQITNPDVVDPATNDFKNRRLDRDYYANIGLESRALYKYQLFNLTQNLAFGARVYNANTVRKQNGRGTTGFDFDLTEVGNYTRRLHFKTNNIALFAENTFSFTDKLRVTPGVRMEYVENVAVGLFAVNQGNGVYLPEQRNNRNFFLAGVGVEYDVTKRIQAYGNISQSYRPVLFGDLTPPATTDVVDENLKDASGYNVDLGVRGKILKFFTADVSYFYMRYNDRIGVVSQFVDNNPANGTFQFRTNLGSSIHKGVESSLDLNVTEAFKLAERFGTLNIFGTLSWISARYNDFRVTSTTGTGPNVTITETNLSGNRVENAPRYIHTIGLTYTKSGFTFSTSGRFNSAVYTDAQNTLAPSANGNVGKLDKYQVFDVSLAYNFLKKYTVTAGASNFTDETYATRRAGGYPGPGILPGEGRTFYLALTASF